MIDADELVFIDLMLSYRYVAKQKKLWVGAVEVGTGVGRRHGHGHEWHNVMYMCAIKLFLM